MLVLVDTSLGQRLGAYWFGKKEIMVFGLYAQIFEYRVGPKPFHMILDKSVRTIGRV